MATAILRLPTVKARTGLSRSTIYLRISEGRSRNPSLGSRAVGWVEAEITDWLNQQIEASRKAAHCSDLAGWYGGAVQPVGGITG